MSDDNLRLTRVITYTLSDNTKLTFRTTRQFLDWTKTLDNWQKDLSSYYAREPAKTFDSGHFRPIIQLSNLVNSWSQKLKTIDDREAATVFLTAIVRPAIQASSFYCHDMILSERIDFFEGKGMREHAQLLIRDLIGTPVSGGEIINAPNFHKIVKEAYSDDLIEDVDLPAALEAIKIEKDGLRDEIAVFLENCRETQVKFDKEANGSLLNFVNEFNKTIEDSKSENSNIKKTIETTKTELHGLKNAYETHMQMKASETLWSDRNIEHNRFARNWLLTFGSWCALSILALSAWYYFFINNFYPTVESQEIKLISSDSAYLVIHLLAYGGPIIFTIWIAKIILANYRTNQSLARDARERETMIQTFVALEKEGKASDEERTIILQSIFRPNGMKVEDSLPYPIWDVILKRLDSKGDK